MTTSALRKMSEQEYLRSEETSDVKREYVDGFVYPLHAQAIPPLAPRDCIRVWLAAGTKLITKKPEN